MNKDRLLTLADGVDELGDDELDLGMFVTKHAVKYRRICGTVCCVIGWCPKFFPDDWKWVDLDYAITPVCGGHLNGWSSAKDFFDLTYPQAIDLFGASSYPPQVKPSVVAARIRWFANTESMVGA